MVEEALLLAAYKVFLNVSTVVISCIIFFLFYGC